MDINVIRMLEVVVVLQLVDAVNANIDPIRHCNFSNPHEIHVQPLSLFPQMVSKIVLGTSRQ